MKQAPTVRRVDVLLNHNEDCDEFEFQIVMVLQDSLSHSLVLLTLEALCMICAVHLCIVRIYFLQNDAHWTLGPSQVGRTLAAICKRTDITVTYHIVAHVMIVFFSLHPMIHLGLCRLIL